MGRNAKRMRAGFGKALSVLLSAVLLLSMFFPSAAVALVGSEGLGAGSSQTEDAGNAESTDAPVASDVQAALPDEGEADASDEVAGAEEAKDEAGDGKVASDAGELGSFAFVKAANAEEDMDIAEAGATAFAVYSDDDKSLCFYKRADVPNVGDTFNGKAATAVYTGIETDTDSQPWGGYHDSITSAEVVDEGIRPVSTAFWFYDCSNMTDIEGLGRLDAGAVTTMRGMFYGCSGLTSLNGISGWETGSVENMSGMFYGCSTLASLDLSAWGTGAVKETDSMFQGCSSLVSLDLSGWDTRAVRNMHQMFRGCSDLTSLDGISGWETGSVENMSGMFYGCLSLASLDLSAWGTGAVKATYSMFYGCLSLASLDGISGWDTGAVEDMSGMFYGCSSLASLDLSAWGTGAVKATDSMFSGCSSLASLNLSGWGTGAVEDMSGMFRDCTSLASLDLSGWDTGAVVTMAYMFSGCFNLQQVTLGAKWKWIGAENHLPTPSSAHIPGADGKWYSSSGTAFAASEIPSGVADTYYASKDLVPKTAFAVYSADDKSLCFYKRADVPNVGDTFNGKAATAVYTGIETDTDSQPWGGYHDSITSAEVVDEGIRPVSMAYWFFGFSNMTSAEGLGKLDTGAVTTMHMMFFGCHKLASLDLSGWDTGKVTEMEFLFSACSSLVSLKLSGWDTGAVTSMAFVFRGCSKLTSLDLSGWDTRTVRNMRQMFRGCSGLTSLDGISGWETGSVEDMFDMFRDCTSLTSLDVSGWDTGAVKDMSNMFRGCTSLATLDVSGWGTGGVKATYSMFRDCSSLTSLDLSSWDTGALEYMDSMFQGCSSLTSLDLSSWDTGNVYETYTGQMFDGCSNLQQVTLGANWKWVGTDNYLPTPSSSCIPGADGSWYSSSGKAFAASEIPSGVADTYYANKNLVPKAAFAVYSDDDNSLSFYKRVGVPSAGDQFNGKTATAVYTGIETDVYSQPWEGYCDSIRKVEVVDEGISPVSTAFWFRDCSNLTSIEGVGKLDTRAVKTMYYMFFNCPKLTSLDLSGWNTGKVTDMDCMFWGCSSITSLNLSGWDTGSVEIMADLFSRCSSLASIDGVSGWDTGSVKNMYDIFRGCSSLTSLDLSGWDTGSVWNMTSMFRGCSKLASLDLSGWDTGSVRNMRCMFQDCSELTLLDGISGWDTRSVENMYGMFLGCSSLSSLDLSGWDARVVTVTDSMFSGCSSLASLDLSGWNTRTVEYMDSMFSGCSRLAKLVLGPDTSLGRMADSDAVTSCKWIKGAEADQNVVEGTYLLTANEDIAAGETETFHKAVFFDTNDGTGAAPTARSLYDLGWTYSSESVADVVRDGYGFNGWYTESSGGARLTDGDALSPTTYYAQWTKSLHSLTVTNQVAGEEPSKSQVSRTGDSTAAAWPLAILGAAALAAVLVSARRRRS